MIINKKYLSQFSPSTTKIALATKAKLFDPSFSTTSEILVYDYKTHVQSGVLESEYKYNKLLWCSDELLAGGMENGYVEIYAVRDGDREGCEDEAGHGELYRKRGGSNYCSESNSIDDNGGNNDNNYISSNNLSNYENNNLSNNISNHENTNLSNNKMHKEENKEKTLKESIEERLAEMKTTTEIKPRTNKRKYTPDNSSFTLKRVFSNTTLLSGDVVALDYNTAKSMLACGSSRSKLILINTNQLDKCYSSGIQTNLGNITALSWNRRVSHILALGNAEGEVVILDLRQKKEVMRMKRKSEIKFIGWSKSTGILVGSEESVSEIDLASGSVETICGGGNMILIDQPGHEDSQRLDDQHSSLQSKAGGTLQASDILSYTPESANLYKIDGSCLGTVRTGNVFNISVDPKREMISLCYTDDRTEILTYEHFFSRGGFSYGRGNRKNRIVFLGRKIVTGRMEVFKIKKVNRTENKEDLIEKQIEELSIPRINSKDLRRDCNKDLNKDLSKDLIKYLIKIEKEDLEFIKILKGEIKPQGLMNNDIKNNDIGNNDIVKQDRFFKDVEDRDIMNKDVDNEEDNNDNKNKEEDNNSIKDINKVINKDRIMATECKIPIEALLRLSTSQNPVFNDLYLRMQDKRTVFFLSLITRDYSYLISNISLDDWYYLYMFFCAYEVGEEEFNSLGSRLEGVNEVASCICYYKGRSTKYLEIREKMFMRLFKRMGDIEEGDLSILYKSIRTENKEDKTSYILTYYKIDTSNVFKTIFTILSLMDDVVRDSLEMNCVMKGSLLKEYVKYLNFEERYEWAGRCIGIDDNEGNEYIEARSRFNMGNNKIIGNNTDSNNKIIGNNLGNNKTINNLVNNKIMESNLYNNKTMGSNLSSNKTTVYNSGSNRIAGNTESVGSKVNMIANKIPVISTQAGRVGNKISINNQEINKEDQLTGLRREMPGGNTSKLGNINNVTTGRAIGNRPTNGSNSEDSQTVSNTSMQVSSNINLQPSIPKKTYGQQKTSGINIHPPSSQRVQGGGIPVRSMPGSHFSTQNRNSGAADGSSTEGGQSLSGRIPIPHPGHINRQVHDSQPMQSKIMPKPVPRPGMPNKQVEQTNINNQQQSDLILQPNRPAISKTQPVINHTQFTRPSMQPTQFNRPSMQPTHLDGNNTNHTQLDGNNMNTTQFSGNNMNTTQFNGNNTNITQNNRTGINPTQPSRMGVNPSQINRPGVVTQQRGVQPLRPTPNPNNLQRETDVMPVNKGSPTVMHKVTNSNPHSLSDPNSVNLKTISPENDQQRHEKLQSVNYKISFLREMSALKKGILLKSKINNSLDKIKLYETKDPAVFTDRLVDALFSMFGALDVDQVREAIDTKQTAEVKNRWEDFKRRGDDIVREFRGSCDVEFFVGGFVVLFQVVIS